MAISLYVAIHSPFCATEPRPLSSGLFAFSVSRIFQQTNHPPLRGGLSCPHSASLLTHLQCALLHFGAPTAASLWLVLPHPHSVVCCECLRQLLGLLTGCPYVYAHWLRLTSFHFLCSAAVWTGFRGWRMLSIWVIHPSIRRRSHTLTLRRSSAQSLWTTCLPVVLVSRLQEDMHAGGLQLHLGDARQHPPNPLPQLSTRCVAPTGLRQKCWS